MTLEYTEKAGGKTVYTAARRELMVSAALLRRLKAADAIYVNGESVFTNYVLNAGDVLTLDVASAEAECDLVPEYGELEVLWENEGLLAVNKPCGMLVHPSRAKYTGTLANFVAGYLPEGVCHAVNRLDRDTSGVVLFSKCAHWKERAICSLSDTGKKEYIAIVCGCPEPLCGTVDAPIKRLCEGDMLRVVSPDGQRAVTRYETLFTDGRISLLKLQLETGRTHQIRVHMLYKGCPLLGDVLYKTDVSERMSAEHEVTAQALHAEKMSFIDPVTGRYVSIFADVCREDMKKAIKNLKNARQNT